ncbi:hypothetical protein PanWU01x14_002840 [Parasponia andersonii]|uniref:Uncharacterized protein n=1 Tax=Parasponia andersonii TaxID=3476 RepID=A0A2P5E5A1_PARAD|nr:hypothetical protein PanWU01x14_002840 [Parasponia andersonii]
MPTSVSFFFLGHPITSQTSEKPSNISNVHRVAKEHEGRCGRVTTTSTTAKLAKPLVVIDAEERERELDLVASPDSAAEHARVAAESTQHGADADHVEPLVPAERHHHGPNRRRRRGGHVAEAEVLPERVVACEGAPEPAHARGHAEGGAVQALQDLYEDVNVVV